MKHVKIILALLILAEIILSGYLVYTDYKGSGICLVTTDSTCNAVQDSIYGQLFGVKLTVFGVIAFSILLVTYLLSHPHKIFEKIFFIFALIGALFSIYFLSLQFFVLNKICSSCVIIDNLMIAIFALGLFIFLKSRRINRKIPAETNKKKSYKRL